MPLEDLRTIWRQAEDDVLTCCQCGRSISTGPLFRTYSVGQTVENKPSDRFLDVGNETEIRLVDRHLNCMREVKYVAISHVWHPEISKIQRGPPDAATAICLSVIDISLKVFRAVHSSAKDIDEIWLDYVSVPQWSEILKNDILSAIPEIYSSAYFVAAHLADLEYGTIKLLQNGKNTHERVKAITAICNAAYLRRVWCASEFIRSSQVRMLDKHYKLLDNPDDPIFFNAMMRTWDQELSRHNSHGLEHMAGHGNLVPWNLSALFYIHRLRTAVFAHAFAILSSRGCATDNDFVFALNGIVHSPAGLAPYPGPDLAYLQIAKACLLNGDYSPLVMTPELGPGGHDPRDRSHNARAWALNDVFSWGMGSATDRPRHAKDVHFDQLDPILTLAEIGTVTMLQYYSAREGPDQHFIQAADFVLDLTGPDVDDFVASLCTRLYNENTSEVHDRITTRGMRQWLEKVLKNRYDFHRGEMWPWLGNDGALALRDCLGLADHRGGARKESPIEFLNAHGNTLHLHNRNHLIRVRCNGCGRTSAFRAGLFRNPEYVQGATAYRVPGLRYDFTRKDGVGFLVKQGVIVGRLIWAVPSCSCSLLSSVKLKMPKLPKRRPLPDSR